MTCEYKFVRIHCKGGGMFTPRKATEDYQEMISNTAAEGWRLVQIFSPVVLGFGQPQFFDIIFERPKDKAE